MSRLVPILCAAAVVGIGLTAWSQLSASNTELTIPKVAPGSEQPEPDQRRAALHEARCACSLTAMDAAVERAKAATEASPTDAAAWQLLAEAHLERALQRTHLRGMSVGKPTFKSLPEAFAADLDAGAAAVAKARELGDDSANLHRIEAGLMSQRITGLLSAARWNAKIGEALDAAGARDADDPQLHVALGLRKLLAPKMFGYDPEKALEHFEFALRSGSDERAAVFAGMACYLLKKRQLAIDWVERAIATNPANKFARVVVERLRRGEDDPFGRDVTAEEVRALDEK